VVGSPTAAILFAAQRYQHKLFGMLHRQRLEDHLVEETENGGVGANSERERKNCRNCEQGCPAHAPYRIFQILSQGLELVISPHTAGNFLYSGDIAKMATSSELGLFWRCPRFRALLDL